MGKNKPRKLEGEIKLDYQWSLGPIATRFFDELKKERIMGNRCPDCERVLVPPRKFCPRCFTEMGEWLRVSDEGEIMTSTFVTEKMKFAGQPMDPPYGLAVIKLDGADVGLSHMIDTDTADVEEAMKRMKPGARVKAEWREEKKGEIRDIKYFKTIK